MLNFLKYMGKIFIYYILVYMLFMDVPMAIFHIATLSAWATFVWWLAIFIPAYFALQKVQWLHNWVYVGRLNCCNNTNCVNHKQ